MSYVSFIVIEYPLLISLEFAKVNEWNVVTWGNRGQNMWLATDKETSIAVIYTPPQVLLNSR